MLFLELRNGLEKQKKRPEGRLMCGIICLLVWMGLRDSLIIASGILSCHSMIILIQRPIKEDYIPFLSRVNGLGLFEGFPNCLDCIRRKVIEKIESFF